MQYEMLQTLSLELHCRVWRCMLGRTRSEHVALTLLLAALGKRALTATCASTISSYIRNLTLSSMEKTSRCRLYLPKLHVACFVLARARRGSPVAHQLRTPRTECSAGHAVISGSPPASSVGCPCCVRARQRTCETRGSQAQTRQSRVCLRRLNRIMIGEGHVIAASSPESPFLSELHLRLNRAVMTEAADVGAYKCGESWRLGCSPSPTTSTPLSNGTDSTTYPSHPETACNASIGCLTICSQPLSQPRRRPRSGGGVAALVREAGRVPHGLCRLRMPHPDSCHSVGCVCRPDARVYESRRDSAQCLEYQRHTVSGLVSVLACHSRAYMQRPEDVR